MYTRKRKSSEPMSYVNLGIPSQRAAWPTCDYPVLPRNEATCSDGYIAELECLDDGLRNVGPYVHMSCPPSVCAFSSKLFGACIPLYSVVRIHGSIGWKSSRQFSSYHKTVVRGIYRFLRCVSSLSGSNSVFESSPLTLSDRANSCLCCSTCVSFLFALQL